MINLFKFLSLPTFIIVTINFTQIQLLPRNSQWHLPLPPKPISAHQLRNPQLRNPQLTQNNISPLKLPISTPYLKQSAEMISVATANAHKTPFVPPQHEGQQFRRVCYFRMDPKTEIRLSQVDGTLCTHVIMAFARIDSSGNICLARDEDLTYLLEVPEFKRQFSTVKVMISIFNEEEHNGFPKVANQPENRQNFARSAMDFMQHYHLDGLDLDWEFPNFPTTPLVGREHERLGLTKILKSVRSAIVENYYNRQVTMAQQQISNSYTMNHAAPGASNNSSSLVEPYILTMAIAAQEAVLKASYELRQVANLCDWLNIMSYDYFLFKLYAPFTGPNSPLHSVVEPYVPIINRLSIEWTLNKLLEEGIAKNKIVMGIPTYARAYRLMFRNSQPAPFTLAIGPMGGRIQDYLDYREVCEMLGRPDTIVEFDQKARVPYMLTDFGYTWVSYENPQSVREKVRYVLENNLAGYMTWNLNSDDFIGVHEHQQNGHITGTITEIQTIALDRKATFPLHRAMLDEVRQFEAN